MANESLVQMFLDIMVRHISYSHSDHCLILIQMANSCYQSQKRFRFETWWTLEKSFTDEVSNLWKINERDVLDKLDRMEVGLSQWAKTIRGRNGSIEKDLMNKLEELLEG